MNLVLLFLILVFAAGILLMLVARTRLAGSEPQEAENALPSVPLIRPAGRAPLTITPARAHEEDIITIVRQSIPVIVATFRPVWQERGWTREQSNGVVVYTGEYHVLDEEAATMRFFKGVIYEYEAKGRELDVYAQSIPPELHLTGRHPKRYCFRPIDPKNLTPPVWYKLHWAKPAQDVSTAILYMEGVLYEALNHSW